MSSENILELWASAKENDVDPAHRSYQDPGPVRFWQSADTHSLTVRQLGAHYKIMSM